MFHGACYRVLGKRAEEVVKDNQLDLELLHERGLSETFSDCFQVGRFQYHNTDAGVVIYPFPNGWNATTDSFVVTNEITWVNCGSKYEVGYCEGGSLEPQYFERAATYVDYNIFDSADNEWMIAVIQSPKEGRCQLPQETIFNTEKMTFQFRLASKYDQLFERVGIFLDMFVKKEDVGHQLDVDDDRVWLVETALQVLQVNYRVNIGTFAAMQSRNISLLDPAKAAAICSAGSDWGTWEEHQKKTEAENSEAGDLLELSPGVEVEFESIAQLGGNLRSQLVTEI